LLAAAGSPDTKRVKTFVDGCVLVASQKRETKKKGKETRLPGRKKCQP